MRTAEAMVADLRKLGRSDHQIRIVASLTHAGKFYDRVNELLAMPDDEAAKLAPAPEEEPEAELCEKCKAPLDDDGICPDESSHIDDVLDDDREEEYCEVCGALLVDGNCNNWMNHEVETIEDTVAREFVEDNMPSEEETQPDPPPKKKRRRML